MAISIDEARAHLGPESERLSDAEIQAILEDLYVLANDLLDLYQAGDL